MERLNEWLVIHVESNDGNAITARKNIHMNKRGMRAAQSSDELNKTTAVTVAELKMRLCSPISVRFEANRHTIHCASSPSVTDRAQHAHSSRVRRFSVNRATV